MIVAGDAGSPTWRTLGLASFVVAVVAMITATVVVGLKGADALASIALALSILSFVVQIILFVLQANTSNQQLFQSQALNSETQKLLEEVRVRATSTQDLLSGQFNTLLEHALGIAADKAQAKTGINSDDLQSILRESLVTTAVTQRQSAGASRTVLPSPPARRGPSETDRLVLAELEKPPTEKERADGLRAIRNLSLGALREFAKYVQDEYVSRRKGTAVGFVGEMNDGEAELVKAGILERTAHETGGQIVLTAKGRQLARVYAAEDPEVISPQT